MKLINQLEDQLNKIKEKENRIKIDYDNPKPIDGKLHPLHHNKELIEKNAYAHWSSPFVYFDNYPIPPHSYHYEEIIKDLKKNLKKNPDLTKSTLLNETYNKKLMQIDSLKSGFPGFGPKNLCGNKEFIDSLNFTKFRTKIVEAALLNKIIMKEKISKSIRGRQASEWDEFISSEGEKIFNPEIYFLPLKEFYYEQKTKQAEKLSNWNYEDEMRKIAISEQEDKNKLFIYLILGVGVIFLLIMFTKVYEKNNNNNSAPTYEFCSKKCKPILMECLEDNPESQWGICQGGFNGCVQLCKN